MEESQQYIYVTIQLFVSQNLELLKMYSLKKNFILNFNYLYYSISLIALFKI